MGRLRLKLDPFHAMQRLSKLVLKSHGACGAYMARLRDALFMVHSEDLAAMEATLRLLEKTPAEIEEKTNRLGEPSSEVPQVRQVVRRVLKMCKCRFVFKRITDFFPSLERINFVDLRISPCKKPSEIDVDADSEKPNCTLPPDDVCNPTG